MPTIACWGWCARYRWASAATPKPAARAGGKLAARELACSATLSARADRIISEERLGKELDGWSHERDDWSLDIISRGGGRVHPRRMLRELELAMPEHVMVSTDIGNICSVSNSYLRFDEPNSMLAAMSFGNCGYALPALIGAKLGRPTVRPWPMWATAPGA